MKRAIFIPVLWQVSGYVKVKAESVEEAFEYALENKDEFKLPRDGEYVAGSFEIDEGGVAEDPDSTKKFDKALLKEARKMFPKVFVDTLTETGYSGSEEETKGCRIRIYPTTFEYDTPLTFRSNEELELFLGLARSVCAYTEAERRRRNEPFRRI